MSKMMKMSKKREKEQELLTNVIIVDKIEEAGMTIGDAEIGGRPHWELGMEFKREDAAVKEER
jgi:hypothetical protein